MSRLVILTPDPDDDDRYDDWREQAELFASLLPAVEIEYRPWSAKQALADLTMPLMAWGYHRHIERWYAALDSWEASRRAFANPVRALRWNTDKRYLIDLASKGVPVVPTEDVARLDAASLAVARGRLGARDVVVKPPVSAGSDATFRLSETDALPGEVLGARMLVQPMMRGILAEGELSLFYLGGTLVHSIVKRARTGDFRVQPQFGGESAAIVAPASARSSAEAALAAIGEDMLYARVDLVPDAGVFRVMEVELIEPWLYLERASDGGAAFARAIEARLASVFEVSK